MALTVGFLGAGFIAQFHLAMLRGGDAEVDLVAVHDPDPDRQRAFADGCGAEAVASEEDVLEAAQAVFVCTWTSEHERLMGEAARRGKAVFCEKPLSTDLPSAQRTARAVAEAGVTNMVGLVLRSSPAFTMIRQILGDPRTGRCLAVAFRDDQYLPVRGMYGSTWRADRSRAGSGVLLEHSIHDVDILEWLLGPAVSVSAVSESFHGIEGIEDSVGATFRFASGTIASLVTVWHDVLERPSQRRVEVLCERAHITLEGDWFGPVRWRWTGEEEQVLENRDLVDALDPPPAHAMNPDAGFVTAAERGEAVTPDVMAALRAHVLVDAAYRSAAADGHPVQIPESAPGYDQDRHN